MIVKAMDYQLRCGDCIRVVKFLSTLKMSDVECGWRDFKRSQLGHRCIMKVRRLRSGRMKVRWLRSGG